MQRYPMRRKDRELTTEDAMDILSRAEYGILSTVDKDGAPYGVPLSFAIVGKTIYFHGTNQNGHKYLNIGTGCDGCFTAVASTELLPGQFGTKYESAMAFGKVALVADAKEKEAGLQAILHKYSHSFWNKGLAYIASAFQAVGVFKLEIEFCTGKARR